MKSITLDEIMDLYPCGEYSRERIAKLMGRRKSVTALDVLAADIPDGDRLWLVLRPELLDERTLRELACDFAQSALERHGNGDIRSQQAVDMALGYAAGVVCADDMAEVRADARYAAWAAEATSAAGAAAREEQVTHIVAVLEGSR